MAFRRRFTAEEKVAFAVGTVIEWQNGAHWHPGRIVEAPHRDENGWWSVGVAHTGRQTATIHPGQFITGLPGKVRLPVARSAE
jgi:hypothetical protein